MQPFVSKYTIPAFLMSFAITLFGMILNTQLIPNMDEIKYFFPIGYLPIIIFIVLGFREVISSSRISNNEKWMWCIGFVFMNLVAGLVYVINGRKRVVELK
jgi:hypothetical protein